jgi:hypothetical protein
MNTTDKTAVERGIAEMVAAQTKPLAKIDKNFAASEHRGISELLAEVAEMLEVGLNTVRLAQERLADFNNLQNRFYNGGGK